jgi:hypothetical protein
MTGGRILPLVDENGAISMEAPFVTMAAMAFPNDIATVENVVNIIVADMMKIAAKEMLGLSGISQQVVRNINKSSEYGLKVGEVVLQLLGRSVNSGDDSLKKAIFIVSRWAEETKREDGKALPADQRNLEKQFSRYRDASHFWAALRLFDEQDLLAFAADRDNLRKLFLVADLFRHHLEERQLLEGWNPYLVPPVLIDRRVQVTVPHETPWVNDALEEYRSNG